MDTMVAGEKDAAQDSVYATASATAKGPVDCKGRRLLMKAVSSWPNNLHAKEKQS